MSSTRWTVRTLTALLGAVVVLTLVVPATAGQPTSGATGPAAAEPATLDDWSAGGLVTSAAAPAEPEPVEGFGTVGGCTFYATSSLAGGYCVPLAAGVPQSLRAWLNGTPFSYCRYIEIPEGMAIEVEEQPGGRWMLKICIQDVDFTQPWGGRDTHLEVFSEWVADERYDEVTRLSPKMQEFWRVQDDRHYYPLPRILVGPTQKAYVGTYTYFWAEWVDHYSDASRVTKPFYRFPYRVGGGRTVYLEASIGDLTIHPGRAEMQSKQCGDASTPFRRDIDDFVPRDEGGAQPSTCWFVYPNSSADQERGTVQVRGTATWNVRVLNSDGSEALNLGNPYYEIDQRIAVAEVQSIVDSDPSDW